MFLHLLIYVIKKKYNETKTNTKIYSIEKNFNVIFICLLCECFTLDVVIFLHWQENLLIVFLKINKYFVTFYSLQMELYL